jgi:hypothetical protein
MPLKHGNSLIFSGALVNSFKNFSWNRPGLVAPLAIAFFMRRPVLLTHPFGIRRGSEEKPLGERR